MKKVRITAVRQTVYPYLMARFENPIEHTCGRHVPRRIVSFGVAVYAPVCRVAVARQGQLFRRLDAESDECHD